MADSKIKNAFKALARRNTGDTFFHLKQNDTNLFQELAAGLTTFMAMAYILAVNPNVLAATGMPKDQLFTATALAACFGSVVMGLLANLPYALAPGMGLNFFFVTLCVVEGYSWKYILFILFVEGIFFIILSLLRVRDKLLGAIPVQLRYGISAGIGLFILFNGLQNAGLVVFNEGSLTLGNITEAGVALSLIGIVIVVVLYALKVKGSLLFGIMATWALGIGAEFIGWYQPGEGASLVPTAVVALPAGISDIAMQCFDFKLFFGGIPSLTKTIFSFLMVFFAMFYSDFFDTMGTLVAVAEKSGLKDEDGMPIRAKQAFLSDAIATVFGALMGTSTTTTYIESATGIMQGGRTGLTAIFTGVFFFLALFLSPVFMAVPTFAVAPVLIFVGFLMMEPFFKLDYTDFTESFPAVLCAAVMPFTSSIANGIAVGIIAYTVINALTGKIKKTNVMMWVLTVLFTAYFIIMK